MAESGRRLRVTPALVLWSLLALVAFILVLQNSADTTIQVLGWTVQAPLFVVIVGSMVAGWGLGVLGQNAWSWRRDRAKRAEGKQAD
jgi:uncharacterized integral membrane protein